MAPPQVQGGEDRLNYIFTESGISLFFPKNFSLASFPWRLDFTADETK